MPLPDGGTSNIWALPTDGGPMRPLTDFGDRSVVIARRVSWSPDSKFLYAAVADTDADIVLLDGLENPFRPKVLPMSPNMWKLRLHKVALRERPARATLKGHPRTRRRSLDS